MAVRLSVVVVAYDMARELPRTLSTLATPYQRGIGADDYEVIVVDNGSPVAAESSMAEPFPGRLRWERLDPAPPSPARAANHGIALAEGDLVALIVDGARLASPGLLATALRGASLADQPIVTAPAFHLGEVPHMRAAEVGYDQVAEDRLLASIEWQGDGYSLFGVSTFAGSSHRGWFGPMGESSSLFMCRELWDRLGGLDEAFDLPGGGLVNHDLYRRATETTGTELIEMLGEGTFHQFHGGAATSRRYSWAEMDAQYAARRGGPYRPPSADPLYIGRVPTSTLGHLERSARLALDRQS